MTERKIIPIAPAADASPAAELSSCSGAEPYPLMVLGDSMLPEFEEGEIIIIEPEGLARDGAFVIAEHDGELIFRQLAVEADDWTLHALNPAYPVLEIPGPAAVKGVITQKTRPGRRRAAKFYR